MNLPFFLAAVFALLLSTTNYSQETILVPNIDPRYPGKFGSSMSHSSGQFAIGAPDYSVFRNLAGAVFMFGTQSRPNQVLHGEQLDHFGESVSLWNDMLAVGAPYRDGNEANSGVVVLFEFDGNGWQMVDEVVNSINTNNDKFGSHVAIEDDVLVIGSADAVYIYERNAGVWVEKERLYEEDQFGNPLFTSGFVLESGSLLVKAPREDNNKGALYYYKRDNSTWTLVEKVIGSNRADGDNFGWSLDLEGDVMVVGAPGKEVFPDEDAGTVYVFERSNGMWLQIDRITGFENGNFGADVVLQDNALIIGQPNAMTSSIEHGNIVIFENVDGDWIFTKEVRGPLEDNLGFGSNLESRGNNSLLIGTPSIYDHEGLVFRLDENTIWEEFSYYSPNSGDDGARFGHSVAVDVSGSTYWMNNGAEERPLILVGAPSDKSQGENTGAAYNFTNRNGNTWEQWGLSIRPPFIEPGDIYGESVATSKGCIIRGFPGHDLLANNAGGINISCPPTDEFDFSNDVIIPNTLTDQSRFGKRVCISNKHAFAFAYQDSNNNGSGIYIFERSLEGWNNYVDVLYSDEESYLDDYFGVSMDVEGNYFIVGAPGNDELALDAGAVYVYEYSNDEWTESAKIFSPDHAIDEGFGVEIEMNSNYIFVGTIVDKIYIFKKEGATWVYQSVLNEVEWSQWQTNVIGDMYASETTMALGLPSGEISNTAVGCVYLYRLVGDSWSHVSTIFPNNNAINQQFGTSVGISEELLVVGAPFYSYDRGYLDPIEIKSGATYIYNLDEVTHVSTKPDNKGSFCFDISPNPATSTLWVTLHSEWRNKDVHLQINSVSGHLKHSQQVLKGERIMPVYLMGYSPGLYIVSILDNNRVIQSERFVVAEE